MTRQEKLLFQQIHPWKLWTDFGTSFASTWLLWEARWGSALIVALLPSIAITLWITRFVDLDPYRRSRLGAYLVGHMPPRIVAQRIVGQLLVWVGAASHVLWLVPFGYFVIVLAWLNGLWDPHPSTAALAQSPESMAARTSAIS
mgnify:CR=1 FL=1